jgi:filamentous hemagglutinin family protein
VAIQGQASFDSSQANKLLVTTQNAPGTNGSAINWQSFSIPKGNSTYFQQPNASSTSINRVVTNTPSQLFGTLGSNGNLVLVNQSGITVGAGAVVDTAGFTASSLKMSDADALALRLRFGDGSPSDGTVSVFGNVVARSGDVVLLGSNVATGKDALIQAPNGSTILAAGQQIELTGRGLEGITLQVQSPVESAVNLGTLKGDAVGIFAGTLKHGGLIQATTASLERGKVVLKASGDATVDGAGKIVATGVKGGAVDVLGNRVIVTGQALIDVSGTYAGGTVRIGGDYQGKNADVPNAQYSYFGTDASVKADAIDQGNGGKVIVWADDTTQAHGSISARGGASGGDGGFVETSGHKQLAITGARVTTLAPQGKTGTWLLDPTGITITNGSSPVNVLSGTTALPAITDSEINAALSSNNLIIATADAGDITFDSTANGVVISTGSSPQTLTLTAGQDIVFKGTNPTTFSAPGSTSGLEVVLNASRSVRTDSGAIVTLDGAGSLVGRVRMTLPANKTWDNHGELNINGNADVNLATGAMFKNHSGAVGNIGSTTGFAFLSGSSSPSNNDGIIHNDGMFNVKTDTAFEAEYNQTGSLNIHNATLNLQNAKAISGTIDLAPSLATIPGTLNVTEAHGNTAAFSNLTFANTSSSVNNQTQVNIGGSLGPVNASFHNVVGNNAVLNVNGSAGAFALATIANAASTFYGVNIGADGGLNITNGTLAIAGGNFVVPSTLGTVGDVGILSTGNLTVSSNLTTLGALNLVGGWDGFSTSAPDVGYGGQVNVSGAAAVSSGNNLAVKAGGPISVNGSISSTASGSEVNLTGMGVTVAAGSSVSGLHGVTINAGSGGLFNSGSIHSTKGPISLIADGMGLVGGTITAPGNDSANINNPGSVFLTTINPAGSINIGGYGGTLSLSSADLQTITATNGLVIGGVPANRSSAGFNVGRNNSGGISVNGATNLTGLGGAWGLELMTSGPIAVNAPLSSAGGVSLDGLSVAVTNGSSVTGTHVSITADTMSLSGSAVAAGASGVDLRTYTMGKSISLGAAGSGTLDIADADLQAISSGGVCASVTVAMRQVRCR